MHYTPDTLDIWGDRSEMDYWLGVLLDQVSTVVEKAAACDNKPGVLSMPHCAPVLFHRLAFALLLMFLGHKTSTLVDMASNTPLLTRSWTAVSM